mmetsp:Transcript_22127/g.61893  ORF Transcript_22127/g.61893 Transcript_22127/m.61893 type:complete len:372 (-) Transcript_22127:65-1180(-)
MLLRWSTFVAALCLAVAAAPSDFDDLDGDFLADLELDDECLANGVEGGDCALAAFQLRASKMIRVGSSLGGSPERPAQESPAAPPQGSAAPKRAAGAADGASEPTAVGNDAAGAPQGSLLRDIDGDAAAVQVPLFQDQSGSDGVGEVRGEERALLWVLVRFFAFFVGVANGLLAVLAAYDFFARWRHYARFQSCRTDVQRAQSVLMKGEGDEPLCPYCLEFVRNHWLKSKVVFICGHSFHLDCANKCFVQDDRKAGACPLCACASAAVGSGSGYCFAKGPSNEQAERSAEAKTAADVVEIARESGLGEAACCGGTGPSAEEVRIFLLASLHRKHEETVSQACVQRWSSCHIQIWLSELVCPRYSSIFRRRC